MIPLRRGVTPLGRLKKYPKNHVTTGEESSGTSLDFTQGLRPHHRRERNPERPRSHSDGNWPFLTPPERVPEVPAYVENTCHNSRKSRRFSPPGKMRPISAEALEANHT